MRVLILLTTLALITSGCGSPNVNVPSKEETQKIISKAKESKLLVVDVYHDHCNVCQDIEPIMKDIENENLENSDITFLKYDLSNPITVLNSKKIAKELGIEKIYKSQRYSGVVLLIDGKSKKVISTLVAETNPKAYKSAISEALTSL